MKRRRFLLLGGLGLLGVRQAAAQFELKAYALDLLAQQLFEKECGGQQENLLWWSPHEPFPSLGIAHFIWLPEEVSVPFEQTFPQLIQFLDPSGQLPAWLHAPYAPWPTRAAWQAEGKSSRMRWLQVWLWHTRQQQAAFVVARFNRRWQQACNRQPDGDRLQQRLQQLVEQVPHALWAVLDYSNFKGFGDLPQERYRGHGWGLVQVIRQMRSVTLEEFVLAAKAVLQRRIQLAHQNERHWWPGWRKRVESYLKK